MKRKNIPGRRFLIICVLIASITGCNSPKKEAQSETESQLEVKSDYNESHRPQIHFSPKVKWTNDPNGMVFYNGLYHLFFQHYPDSSIWGPMHWGHATSKDLVHWEEQKIALYPDSLGYIFSGSAVVDSKNTSGFGKDGKVPLVAIFTHHNPVLERQNRDDHQYQSLAYSLDEGKTWTKYENNPVLKNPGIRDFRDPKVRWFEKDNKWIMTLATKDRITFYSSPDLKNWTKESEFGQDLGAHGGVWECPDLFPLEIDGKTAWVLLVSVNPGAPNGGSGTQYFIGDFDGKRFTPSNTNTKWADFGTDNYAGITWSNTGDRKIFIGWMSNWLYANVVPTTKWRNAMTVPRNLSLKRVKDDLFLVSQPVEELNKIKGKDQVLENIEVKGAFDLSEKLKTTIGQYQLKLTSDQLTSFSIVLSNEAGEEVIIGYDKGANQYYIDRSNSGKTDFQENFAKKHTAPRIADSDKMELTLIVDVASVELFADEGLTVMTDIFFPNEGLKNIEIKSQDGMPVKKVSYTELNSIWE